MATEIFKKLSKEDILNMDQTDFAYYGWEGDDSFSFWAFAEAYKKGSDVLFEKMRDSKKQEIDSLIYPFCFLKRHYMELCLKYFSIKYVNKDEISKKNMLNLNHGVQVVWDKMESILQKKAAVVGSSVNFTFLKDCVRSMQDFDSKSMQMRYPIDKSLKKQNEATRLDYNHVQQIMEKFSKEMEKLDNDIDNQVEKTYTKEEKSEFEQNYQKYKTKIESLLSLAKKKSTISKTGIRTCLLDDINNDINNDIDQFINNLNGDESIIIKVLYYGGRDVNEKQINLPNGKSKKKTSFIDYCLFLMETYSFNFGENPVECELEITGKYPEDLIKNIETSVTIMEKN